MVKKKLTPMVDLLKEWKDKGVKEIYGFSGRYGMVFHNIDDILKDYQSHRHPEDYKGRVTLKGYVVEDDGYRVGQLVHPQFGWE